MANDICGECKAVMEYVGQGLYQCPKCGHTQSGLI